MKSLFNYWQDNERVKKFLDAGSRDAMVAYVVKKYFKQIKNANWLDIGAGPGFIQNLVNNGKYRLSVALDISISALLIHGNEDSQKVAGSFRFFPFRINSFSFISTFFCLSDYPITRENISQIHSLLCRNGHFLWVDYSAEDEYWELRKKNHKPDGLQGNINLRKASDLGSKISDYKLMKLLEEEEKTFVSSGSSFKRRLNQIPDKILRKFFILLFKS